MSIVLFRVDERLIHGQVIVGWGSQLHPDRIIVVDDALTESTWEQELYTLGLPDDVEPLFATVESARSRLPEWLGSKDRIILLTRSVATMRELGADGLLRGQEINIGGLHHAAGRRAVLPYVYLSADESNAMSELSAQGASISARDLPGARRVPFEDLIREPV